MPRRSQADAEFKRHVCGLLDAYIVEHGITDVEAAKVLGVRKQMIRPYREQKSLPGTEAIVRACIYWDLHFRYKGVEISAQSFAAPNGQPSSVPRQLQLPLNEPIHFQSLPKNNMEDVQLTVSFKKVS